MTPNMPSPARFHPRTLPLTALALGVIYVLWSSVTVIPAGRAGVVFSALGGVKPGVRPSGLTFTAPLIEHAVLYDTRLQEVTLAHGQQDAAGEGAIRGRSKEGLDITADVTVQFRVNPTELPALHRELGPNYLETVVRPQVRSKVRDVVGQFGAADLISSQRQAVEAEVARQLTEVFTKNHLQLDAVLLRELKIPDSVAKAIEEKQTAEQQVQIERNRLQQADISAQRQVVVAEGEAKAAVARAKGEAQSLALRGQALRNNPQLVQLTVAEKLAPTIQTVMLPSGGNFLLDLQSLGNKGGTVTNAKP
ncbi:prohibitin family protein [Deinococcus hopiensis]|uniref:Regulator of protease activity HflC, stomatin/prohibitin superfamily n=1 Tax=Deinococcus hopiensis KR-140 TaxID=695939 RepID=A0A1W1VG39_9DEIO|nr:prohibitin family protein [Deinococcus hopiensis]SMB92322.1 Regulator of protease activity HflC, stomatin/prohibitin superfamily [Deinococcus hopiensis KR-140]